MLDVVIIGAGLSGLAAARHLKAQGLKIKLVEAEDRAGGREKTDHYQGFLLDHGFHVFLTAYPEAQELLDYAALELKPFYNGALIWSDGKLQKVADPWRHPLDTLPSIMNQIGELTDKLKIKTLKEKLIHQANDDIFSSPESSTLAYLKEYGFTDKFIKQFFKPFLGGIFLEPNLETTSRFFEFVFKMFSVGDAALPANGIQAIPQQLTQILAQDELLVNQRVSQVQTGAVTLADGTTIHAKAIILATDAKDAETLIGKSSPDFNSTFCVYFSAAEPPISEPILVLNGSGQGIVNNLCVPTLVCPSYSSSNLHLISVSVLETGYPAEQLANLIQVELKNWFGDQIDNWVHLKTYSIPCALPTYNHSSRKNEQSYEVKDGIYRCGDYMENPSINGALLSGRVVAEKVGNYLNTLKTQTRGI